MNEIKAVIFDMDGVLVNSEPFYVEVEQDNFRQLGLNVTHEEHITYQGTATELMWEKVIEKHGLEQTAKELTAMTNSVVVPYFKRLETIDPMPGVTELIKQIAEKDIPMAVASSSNCDVINIILNKTALRTYFREIVSSEIAGSSKPDPGIFLYTAKKLNVNPENCLVIEDSTNGIEAAHRAGMYCVAYAGPGSEHQDQSGADRIISDFSELKGVFP